MSKNERRHSDRQKCLVPVEGKSAFANTQTVDISRHGIGFISDQEIPLNENIVVEIALTPDTEPVLVRGIVKWVRKISDADQYRIGMTLAEVISGSQSRLNQYLRKDSSFFPDS